MELAVAYTLEQPLPQITAARKWPPVERAALVALAKRRATGTRYPIEDLDLPSF